MVQIPIKKNVKFSADTLLGKPQSISKKDRENLYMEEFESQYSDYTPTEIMGLISEIETKPGPTFYDKCLLKYLRKYQKELISEGEHYYAE